MVLSRHGRSSVGGLGGRVLVAALPGWPIQLVGPPALACFAVGGLLYAPYPALSATLFQRESRPELLSQALAARGALTVLATPLGTALGGPLTAWLGAQHTQPAWLPPRFSLPIAGNRPAPARPRAVLRRPGRNRGLSPGSWRDSPQPLLS